MPGISLSISVSLAGQYHQRIIDLKSSPVSFEPPNGYLYLLFLPLNETFNLSF